MKQVLEGDHVSNIGEKIEKTGTREKDDYKERLGRCCVYVREGEVGREMATKNHTITKGLFIYFIRDKLFEVCGLFCLLTFEEKQRKGEEERKRTVGLI